MILKEMYANVKKMFLLYYPKKKNTNIFSKKFTEMDEGKYEFQGLVIKYRINKEELKQMEILILIFIKKDKDKYIQIQIQKNYISPMPEVSFETKLEYKNNQISDYTNYYDIIEDDYIEINDIYTEIKSNEE